jgi:hypothetical protein
MTTHGKGNVMLSPEDRDWLTNQFNLVHQRINEEAAMRTSGDMKNGSDIANIRENMVRIELNDALVRKHEDQYHNPAKTWGVIGGVIAVLTFLVEGLKMLFKSKGGA